MIAENIEQTFTVYQDPVVESATAVLGMFNKSNIIILRGKGNAIPNTVAVANIITENFLKNNSEIKKIIVDSEISDVDGRMVSNIEITLQKNQ